MSATYFKLKLDGNIVKLPMGVVMTSTGDDKSPTLIAPYIPWGDEIYCYLESAIENMANGTRKTYAIAINDIVGSLVVYKTNERYITYTLTAGSDSINFYHIPHELSPDISCNMTTTGGQLCYDKTTDTFVVVTGPSSVIYDHYNSGSDWLTLVYFTTNNLKAYATPPKALASREFGVRYNAVFKNSAGFNYYNSVIISTGKASMFGYDATNIPDYPDGDGDDDSDDIEPNPIFPTSATGFVTLYSPTKEQLKALAKYMWSKDFVDIFVKLFENPYDSIISIKNVCCNFSTGGTTNIILGNVETTVQAAEITQQYQQIDCGSIQITRYFGNFLDYNPYTSIKIYLPFIGYRELDVDEVMGSTLHLYYNVDLLTGSCVALIHINKSLGGTNLNSVLYQFDGVIANEIPVTASDYSQVISAVMRGVATTAAAIGVTAATGGTGAVAGGALLGSASAGKAATTAGTFMAVNSAIDTVTSKVNITHGGSLGASMGVLATKKPYIIITRVIEKNPTNYTKLHGIPSNAYKKLSSLKGFTKMQDIQIKSTIGSVDETEEIKQLLLGGVVI